MTTIPLKIVDGSYESRSLPVSAQRTVNFYPEPVPDGKAPSVLMSWPGAKLLVGSGGLNRGMLPTPWKGDVYLVNGQNLYKLSSSMVMSDVGDIPGGERCVMAASQNYVYVVTEGKVYRCNGSTTAEVTDADLESPNSGAFISSFMIYDGSQGRFVVSDAGDGGSINSLNYATAESMPDDLRFVYTFRDVALMVGERSIEPWYVSGSGSPPVDKIQGGTIPVGAPGNYCMTNTDIAVYYLGHDRIFYRLEGYNARQVSTPAVNNALSKYSEVSDCFAFALKLEWQSFIVFQFPSEDQTWVFSETHSRWFELCSGVDYQRHLANGYCFAFGKHLITDYQSGNVYEWDLDTFEDNSKTVARERTTQAYTSRQFGQAGKSVFWNSIELVVNPGNGLLTGQGSDPQVMMSFSDDGGITWSQEYWASIGQTAQHEWRVQWYDLGMSESRIYKFRVTDPVDMNIIDLYADIELGY